MALIQDIEHGSSWQTFEIPLPGIVLLIGVLLLIVVIVMRFARKSPRH